MGNLFYSIYLTSNINNKYAYLVKLILRWIKKRGLVVTGPNLSVQITLNKIIFIGPGSIKSSNICCRQYIVF